MLKLRPCGALQCTVRSDWATRGLVLCGPVSTFRVPFGRPALETRSPSSRAPLTNVLLATDFSSASEKALQYALNLARRYGATLHIVHVLTPDPLHSPKSAAGQRQLEEAWLEGRQFITRLIVAGE